MKRLVTLLPTLILTNLCLAQTAADPNEGTTLTHGSANDTFTLSWWGRSGRTYFIQQSDDLINWQYVPIIESGEDDVIEWGFSSNADKFFMRLKYTDIVTSDPLNDDFDGDGIGNMDELTAPEQLNLDPLDPDSNENDIPDGFEDTDDDSMLNKDELAYGLDPFTNDAMLDLDGDRYPNIYELRGLNGDPGDHSKVPGPTYTIPANFTTLQAAIDAVSEDYGIILLEPGVYAGANNSDFVINGNDPAMLLISEEGAANTVLDGQQSQRGAQIRSDRSALLGVTIQNCVGAYEGGGLYIAGEDVLAANCVIRNNRTDDYGIGGGIYSAAKDSTIQNTLIYGNAADSGGGIYFAYAASSGLGDYGTGIKLIHTTLLNNSALVGDEIYKHGGAVTDITLTNSIVWNDESAINVFAGTDVSADYSIIQGSSGYLDNGNVSNVDPQLTRLGLLTGSSTEAIDKGVDVGILSDIHQELRPDRAGYDIGADEFIDGDGDGLPDWLESLDVTDPSGHEDSDGLSNVQEYQNGTDALNPDTDYDGIADDADSEPLTILDTDGDGMPDNWEIQYGLNPLDHYASGFQGDYYDNENLAGEPVLSRIDSTIDFSWGNGSPNPVIAGDTFSVRWTGYITPDSDQVYTFETLTNDGVRLWIDGELLIDQWQTQSATSYQASVSLLAGREYVLRMEYFEQSGDAQARLTLPGSLQIQLDEAVLDLDHDGATSLQEYQYRTLPNNAHTDSDGFSDGEEISFGSDPLDSEDFPAELAVKQPIADLHVVKDSSLSSIDLGDVFEDRRNPQAPIIKTIQFNTNPSLVSASIAENSLSLALQPDQIGHSTITLQASYGSRVIEHSFSILVYESTALPPQAVAQYPEDNAVLALPESGESVHLYTLIQNLRSTDEVFVYDKDGNELQVSVNVAPGGIEIKINPRDDLATAEDSSEDLTGITYDFDIVVERGGTEVLRESVLFTVDVSLPVVTASQPGGRYADAFTAPVTLSASEENADIYFTVNGSSPVPDRVYDAEDPEVLSTLTFTDTTVLELMAVDTAGNRGPVTREVYTFADLPAPPMLDGLGFTLDGQDRVTAIWSPADGESPAAYRIYHAINAVDIAQLKASHAGVYPPPQRLLVDEASATSYLEAASILPGADMVYGVTAVDATGRESVISVLSDVSPPAGTPVGADVPAAIERAVRWLEARQGITGFWGNQNQARHTITSAALSGLASVTSWSTDNRYASNRGLAYLHGYTPDNNGGLAEAILTLDELGRNTVGLTTRLQLYGFLVGSGNDVQLLGWGLKSRYAPDAYHTAIGLTAINLLPAEEQAFTLSAQDYLSGQSITVGEATYDGAELQSSTPDRYAWTAHGQESLYVSARVAHALNDTSQVQWMLNQQEPDGSFGGDLYDTAAAILYLPLGATEKAGAQNYLASQQEASGSWQNDPQLTGLCLEALNK